MPGPDNPVTGGCFCGQIRYSITAEPRSVGICHCVSCRRIAGAESVAWAVVSADGYSLTSGTPREFNSSTDVTRTHCANCGTSLTYQIAGRDFVDVTLGSLDDPEALTPTREVWCAEAVSWNALNA